MVKRKKLHQKLAKKPHRKIPIVPKSYFLRDCVPPPTVFQGHVENATHYRYKIFLGETLRDNIPYLNMLEYDYRALPDFFHARYDRYLTYLPDIYLKFVDISTETVYVADIEINGLVHYKNKDQILKCKERKDHIYPYLQNFKEYDKPKYKTIASYIVIDKDDFEYQTIQEIYGTVKKIFFGVGGVYPERYDAILQEYLKIAH